MSIAQRHFSLFFSQTLVGAIKHRQYPALPLLSHSLIISAPQIVVHGKKPATPGLMTMPLQGAWKLTQSASGKELYDRQRLTRIAEGRHAVSLSTESQRAHIIERYKAEIYETPMRRKMYNDALQVERVDSASSIASDSEVGAGPGPEGSTSSSVQTVPVDTAIKGPESPSDSESISRSATVSPPLTEAHHEEEDENAVFVREMELAMKLSLEEHEQVHPAKNDGSVD